MFGRQISFIWLLHATRLNADCIDDLAAILKRRRLQAVTLEEAMKDPAYRLGDPYVGKNGIEWMEKGFVTGGKKQFVSASQIAEVIEDSGGLVSPAKLEIRFKDRTPLELSAPLGQRGALHELKEAVTSILS